MTEIKFGCQADIPRLYFWYLETNLSDKADAVIHTLQENVGKLAIPADDKLEQLDLMLRWLDMIFSRAFRNDLNPYTFLMLERAAKFNLSNKDRDIAVILEYSKRIDEGRFSIAMEVLKFGSPYVMSRWRKFLASASDDLCLSTQIRLQEN